MFSKLTPCIPAFLVSNLSEGNDHLGHERCKKFQLKLLMLPWNLCRDHEFTWEACQDHDMPAIVHPSLGRAAHGHG